MEGFKPGDTYNTTRDGKVFLTQFNALGAHVSITRVLGDDPEAEAAALDALADRAWHAAMLANFKLVNDAYGAAGSGTEVDIEKLVAYLERKAEGDVPQAEATNLPAGKVLKRKRVPGK